MELLRNNKKEMLEIKKFYHRLKNALMSSSVDWIRPEKEPVSLKIGLQIYHTELQREVRIKNK